MPATIILDAYNIIHCVPQLEKHLSTSLEEARSALVRYCIGWLVERRDVSEFRVVFDGDSSVIGSSRESSPGIRVEYTRTGETADDRIMRIVEDRSGGRCTVVSNDMELARNCKDMGAAIMTVSAFYSTRQSGQRRHRVSSDTGDDKNLSAAEKDAINNMLKKEWGLE